MAVINHEDLSLIREKHKNERIVFCSGVFDLTHAGHVLFFEDCRRYGDVLVVAVGCDENTRNVKGADRPILSEKVRAKMVSSLKPVDYCFVDKPYPSDMIPPLPEWVFPLIKPDVYVINDDTYEIQKRKEIAERFGIEFIVLRREAPEEFDGISTSKIIKKIRDAI